MLVDAASSPPPDSLVRRALWLMPLLLALLFVAAVLAWAWRNDRADREELRQTLISDALSAEAQLRSRLVVEDGRLRALAAALAHAPRKREALRDQPELEAGLRRLWLGVTWLDANNRIIAQVPEQGTSAQAAEAWPQEDAGLSAHLVAAVSLHPLQDDIGLPESPQANRFDLAGEKLVLRFSPTMLLRSATPWWLTRRYEMRLVDGSDQVIAAVDEASLHAAVDRPESYRVAVGEGMPGTWLELSPREVPPPWWRTLPFVPIGGFLLLVGGASVLLRRQMQQVMRAQAAWRTEAAWRRAMEDSALVGLRAHDAEGRLLYVNRTFCDMVGLPANELIGLLPPFPYWPPDAMEDAMQRSQHNLAGLAPREGYETRWRHADGHTLDVMVFESPLVDAEGRQIGWMGSILDITARKRLEERDRHQTEAMMQQARLTMLGEVASALAHQLNQPLTAIASYAGGVLRLVQQQPKTEPMILQALQRLGEQAAEAGRIVQRIRGFLTRRTPQREWADLPACARRAAQLLHRELAQGHVLLEWELPPTLPPVLADTVLLEQVFINLLRNAMDELKAVEVRRITLKLLPPALASHEGGQFLRVEVHDSGPGLRGQSIETLTAPFFSTKAEGMGMGLAICRSVIEAHHGRMEAGDSLLHGGACFSFLLPLAGEEDLDSDEDKHDEL